MAPPRLRSFLASTLTAAAITGLGVVAVAAQPAPAADKTVQRPAWCDTYGYSETSSYSMSWFEGMTLDSLVENTSVGGRFAEVVCARKLNVPEDRAPLLALRAKWMARMGYDERDFEVVAAEAEGHVGEQQDLAQLGGVGPQLADAWSDRASFHLDKLGAKGSMLAKFEMANHCFGASLGVRQVAETPLLQLILCAGEPLDRSKAYGEIDAIPGINGRMRKWLREMVMRTHDSTLAARAVIANASKDEPGVAKLVAMGDRIRKEWASPTPARAALIAQVEAMEAARASNKRSAFAGCDEPTRAAWTAHLGTVKLPKLPDTDEWHVLRDATIASPEGYLAYRALRLCADGVSAAAAIKDDELGPAYTFRGPRTEMIAAWMRAAGEITFDSRDLDMPSLLRQAPSLRYVESYLPNPSRGVISAIEPEGDAVRISFKRTTATIDACTNWQATNRIERIDDQGNVQYRQECRGWGKVKLDTTADEILLGTVYAAGLKPGMLLIANDRLPIAATSGAKSAAAVWILGAAVK